MEDVGEMVGLKKKLVKKKRKALEGFQAEGFRFVVVALLFFLFLGLSATYANAANAVRPVNAIEVSKNAPVNQLEETAVAEASADDAVLAGPALKSKLVEPRFKVQAVQTLREKFMLQVCAENGETYDTPTLARQAGFAVVHVGPCLNEKQERIREQKCWLLANENAREACLKKEYGLERVRERREACVQLEDLDQQSDCLASLRQAIKGYYNNAFKRFLAALDALQAKFEREGLDATIIIETRAFVEEKRVEFLNASTPEEKKNILKETNEEWREFKQQVLEILHEHLVDKALDRAVNALNNIKTTRDELAGKGYDVTLLNEQITVVEQKIAAASETSLEFKEQVRRLLEVKKSLTQARRIIHAILNGQPIPSPETPSTLPPGNIPTIAPSMPVQTAFPTLASTSTPGEVETQ